MLDNIKAGVYLGANKSDFKNYLRELYGTTQVKNPARFPKYDVYIVKLYKDFDGVDALNKANIKGQPCLRVRILYFHLEERVYITIRNSFRKWYYGTDSLQDFCQSDLNDCMDLVSGKLCISSDFLRDFRIYQMELGLTHEYKKSMSNIMLSIIEHQNLKKQLRVDNETVSFIGDNFTLSCYDKGAEVTNKKSLKEKLHLPDDKFYLRTEIKITKVSGVQVAVDKFHTIGDLCNNLGEAHDYLLKEIRRLSFIDCISPALTEHLLSEKEDRKGDKNKNKEFHDFIRFLGLEYIGFVKFNQMSKIFTNRPSKQRKVYAEIEERFRQIQKVTYRQILLQRIKNSKAEILR